MIRARRLCEQADMPAGARLCAEHTIACAPLLVVLVIASALAPACGGDGATPPGPDGGLDAGDAAADQRTVDGGVNVQPPSCRNARTVCSGNDVVACAGDMPAEVLETCADACSLGRCTTTACLEVEQGGNGISANAARGCRFYGAQVDNIDQEDGKPTMLLISNPATAPAQVRVEMREPGAGWTPARETIVEAGATTRVEVRQPIVNLGLTPGRAFRVDSDAPVTVVVVISDDSDRSSRSSGGTVLRPLQALGLRHLALTAPAQNSAEVARFSGSRAGAGAITVVGTAEQTHVRLRVTAVAAAMEGATLQPRPAGDTTSDDFVLGDGDVLQIFSVDSGGDLTGSSIESDTAVAVFSGNVFTSYGNRVTGGNGADLVLEQLPSLAGWSRRYAGVRLAPSSGCESFFGEGASSWRVLAAVGSTRVTLDPAPGVSLDIPGMAPGTTVFDLAEGQSQAFYVRGSGTDFSLDSTERVLLAQWMDCEPSLSWGVDGRLGGDELAFGLPPGFETEMVIVRERGKLVVLDDTELPAGAFHPISASGALEAARVDAQRLRRCSDAADPCQHRLRGAAFGVTWRGMDVVCSYAVTVPSPSACSLPNVVGCPE